MYKIGDIVECIVTGFKEYGIFVNVANSYSGLIHISEISNSFVSNVKDYTEIGERIFAKVLEVDEKTKQLKLSIKTINYKKDGKEMKETSQYGFEPLKKQLNIWINEKLQELKINDSNSTNKK